MDLPQLAKCLALLPLPHLLGLDGSFWEGGSPPEELQHASSQTSTSFSGATGHSPLAAAAAVPPAGPSTSAVHETSDTLAARAAHVMPPSEISKPAAERSAGMQGAAVGMTGPITSLPPQPGITTAATQVHAASHLTEDFAPSRASVTHMASQQSPQVGSKNAPSTAPLNGAGHSNASAVLASQTAGGKATLTSSQRRTHQLDDGDDILDELLGASSSSSTALAAPSRAVDYSTAKAIPPTVQRGHLRDETSGNTAGTAAATAAAAPSLKNQTSAGVALAPPPSVMQRSSVKQVALDSSKGQSLDDWLDSL